MILQNFTYRFSRKIYTLVRPFVNYVLFDICFYFEKLMISKHQPKMPWLSYTIVHKTLQIGNILFRSDFLTISSHMKDFPFQT